MPVWGTVVFDAGVVSLIITLAVMLYNAGKNQGELKKTMVDLEKTQKNNKEELEKRIHSACEQFKWDREELQKQIKADNEAQEKYMFDKLEMISQKIEELTLEFRGRSPLPTCQDLFRQFVAGNSNLSGKMDMLLKEFQDWSRVAKSNKGGD